METVRLPTSPKEAGLLYEGSTRWGSGCTFIDYDRDGYLDLFVANYVDLASVKLPKPGENPYCNFKGLPVNCGPRGLAMPHNYLYHNQGDGTFREVTAQSGIGKAEKTYAMTAAAVDLIRMAGPISMWLRTLHPVSCFSTATTIPLRKKAWNAGSP